MKAQADYFFLISQLKRHIVKYAKASDFNRFYIKHNCGIILPLLSLL